MLRYMGKKRIRRNVVLKDGWGNVSEIDGRFLICFRDFAKNERFESSRVRTFLQDIRRV